ncbi:hypothetical protein XarCFBP6762_19005 [Xanthomonas arboricola]|nr:hypothetical protein XarCFBP6762_19005 [Xanthomonas arboricola]
MPRKSLQGRTCGVSREGRRARTPQQTRRSSALNPGRRTVQSLKTQSPLKTTESVSVSAIGVCPEPTWARCPLRERDTPRIHPLS